MAVYRTGVFFIVSVANWLYLYALTSGDLLTDSGFLDFVLKNSAPIVFFFFFFFFLMIHITKLFLQ